jgi:hypothetical protein
MNALDSSNFRAVCNKRRHLLALAILMLTTALNVIVVYVKRLAFMFRLNALCASRLLDLGQPQISFAKMLVYLLNDCSL